MAASTLTWTSSTGGDWNTSTDWSPVGPPGTLDLALIGTVAGTYTVTVAAGETPGVGNLTITSKTATVEVDGILTGGTVSTFAIANGALSVLNGGTVVVGSGGLGLAGSSSATVTVSGTSSSSGNHSFLSDSGGINAGINGSALLQILNGGTIELTGVNGITVAASLSAATGTVQVSGAGSLLQLDASAAGMTIGNAGQGTVEALNGGTIAMNGTGGIIVGSAAGSDLLEVSGTGAVFNQSTNGARVAVGGASSGSGTLEVLAGGTMVLDGTRAANDTLTGLIVGKLGAGTVLVDGIGSSLTLGFGAIIGEGANGTLTVQNSGSISNTSTKNFNVGFGASDSGVVVINAGTLTNTNASFIIGGTNTSGSLLVEHGGLLTTGNGTPSLLSSINDGGSGQALATINGGTWTVNGDLHIAEDANGTLDIKTDGTSSGVVSTGTFGIDIGAIKSGGAGTVTVENGGTLSGGQLNIATVPGATGALSIATGGVVTVNSGTISNGGTITLAGGLLDPTAALTVNSGGAIVGLGTLEASTNDFGLISASGGTLDVTGGIAGTGTLEIDSNSTFKVDGTAPTTANVSFTTFGTAETLILGMPGVGFTSAINGLAGTDKIEFNFGTGVAITSAVASGNTITVTKTGGGPTTYLLNNVTFAAGSSTLLNFGSDVATGDQFISVVCFARGTRITTPAGEVAVERLAVGDTVSTMDGKAEPIVWIGTGRTLVTPGRRSAATPVIVRKGALADNVPRRDLRVTKGHSLFIDDALIPVEYLVNHRSIVWDDRAREIEIFHIELARHSVLIAEGAPAESYRDDGNRWLFQNANATWQLPPHPPCAPVLTGGPIVEAAWRRLLDRSGPRPGIPLTDDPDLHLLLDGQRIDATAQEAMVQVFRLRAPHATVRLVSRAAVPQELGLTPDARCLGVALRRIVLRQGTQVRSIDADDARLTEGFHAFEPGECLRWTDGEAALPAELFAGFAGAMELEIHLGCATHYAADAAIGRAA